MSGTITNQHYIVNLKPQRHFQDNDDMGTAYLDPSVVEITITDPVTGQLKDGNAYIAVYC